MIFQRTIATASLLALMAAPGFAQGQTLQVVADEWPPFSGSKLPGKGISLDVIKEVLERANYQVEVNVIPWARIMDGARTGQYDIIGSLFFDPEMTEFLSYSDSYYETEVRFVQHIGSDLKYTGIESLQPYSIAVGDGFLYESNFDAASNLNKIVVTTTEQALRMLAAERVDLTLDSVDVLDHTLSQDAPEIADQITYVSGVLTSQKVYMGVSNSVPNREQILEDFNRTLAEMVTNGDLAQLLKKHKSD